MAVTAACNEAEVRRLKFGEGEVVCGNVPCDVMNGDKRLSCGHGKSLCKAHSDKERADKTWSVGDGDSVKVGEGNICLTERALNNTENIFTMTARGYFRHYSAVFFMLLYLR